MKKITDEQLQDCLIAFINHTFEKDSITFNLFFMKYFDIVEDPYLINEIDFDNIMNYIVANYLINDDDDSKVDPLTTNGSNVSPSQSDVKEIKDYSLDDIVLWRNTASIRVSKYDDDLKYIDKSLNELERKKSKLLKKRTSDIKWIVSLNRILYKAIKSRPKV